MASVLVVGIWSIDTCDQNEGSWLRMPLRDKLSALNQALAAFFRFRLTQAGNVAGIPEPNTIRAIFVAPEYFLAGVRGAYHDRDYVDEMTAKSFKHLVPGPINTLLVPGSIAVRKQSTTARVAKYTTTLPPTDTGVKTGFIKNTAYGFIHSRKVLSCSKQANATDGFVETDPDVFVPGWKTNKALLTVHDPAGQLAPGVSGPQPPPRQLRFGIEICADASSDHHGTGYVDTTDPAPVDVKILVSASLPSATVYHGNYTRALIHAAADAQYSGINVKGNNQTALVQQQRFLGHQLEFHRLTIP